MENNTNDKYKSKIVKQSNFINHIYDILNECEDTTAIFKTILNPKDDTLNKKEIKPEVKRDIKDALNNIFTYFDPMSDEYVGFNALAYYTPSLYGPEKYMYIQLIKLSIYLYCIHYRDNFKASDMKVNGEPKRFPNISRKFYNNILHKKYCVKEISEIVTFLKKNSVCKDLYLSTKEKYNRIFYENTRQSAHFIAYNNTTVYDLPKKINKFLERINNLISYINRLKNNLMTNMINIDYCNDANYEIPSIDDTNILSISNHLFAELYCIEDYIFFFINMLERILDILYDLYHDNKYFNIDYLIQYIYKYQPQMSFEKSIDPIYDYCSFLSFISKREFYRKQEEIYDKMNTPITEAEFDVLKHTVSKYAQDYISISTSDPQKLKNAILKFDKNQNLDFLEGLLDELKNNKKIRAIKICGCHDLIFYIRKYINILRKKDTDGVQGSNYYLEANNYLQMIITCDSAKFNFHIKIRKHLYHIIHNRIFYESAGENTLVFYDITTILQRISELYTCVKNYLER